jgi:hypothetical protein
LSTGALIVLVATILSVDGTTVMVDVGHEAGLRKGDWGTIFFEIEATDHTHTVEVGPATVASTTGKRATLHIPTGLSVKTSHRVRFEIPGGDRSGVPDRQPAADIGNGTGARSADRVAGDPRQGTVSSSLGMSPPPQGASGDVAERLFEVDVALEDAQRVREELLAGLDESIDLDMGLPDRSIDELLEQLDQSERDLAKVESMAGEGTATSPAEQFALVEEVRRREAQLQATQRALDEAESRVLELEREIEETDEPATTKDARPGRKPRWKFWRRSKPEQQDTDSEDVGRDDQEL